MEVNVVEHGSCRKQVAAKMGQSSVVEHVFLAEAPLNTLRKGGHSIGEYAIEAGHQDVLAS